MTSSGPEGWTSMLVDRKKKGEDFLGKESSINKSTKPRINTWKDRKEQPAWSQSS